MEFYDFTEVADVTPGDHVKINDMVMMVYEVAVNIANKVTLTLLVAEEIRGDIANMVKVVFDADERVLRVSEYLEIEEDENE